MIIGVMTVELEIAAAASLKDKRRVLNRVKDRVRRKFNVAIAEVEGNNLWNYAVLGISTVANEQQYANKVLCKVIDLIDSIRDCELAEYAMEFLHE